MELKSQQCQKGSARFRIGLNPNFSKEDLERFVKELKYEIDSVL